MNYICPNCGGTRLEEIMTGVTLSSEITNVDSGDIEYQDPPGSAGDSGQVDRYQCVNCGDMVKDENGEVITDCLELSERLEQLAEARLLEISFTAQGHVKQTIYITDHRYTPEQVLTMLKSGEAVTTVQEDGNVIVVKELNNDNNGAIATVISSDVNLEYDDFDADISSVNVKSLLGQQDE